MNKIYSSWLALVLGLAVGFIVYIIAFSIAGNQLTMWIGNIVAGVAAGSVAAYIDRKNALIAALVTSVFLFSYYYSSAIIQLNMQCAGPESLLSELANSQTGIVIGGILSGLFFKFKKV